MSDSLNKKINNYARCTWPPAAVQKLIYLRGIKYEQQFIGRNSNNPELWIKIKNELGNVFNLRQITKKWNNLIQKYKEVRDYPPQKKHAGERWIYFDVIGNILKNKNKMQQRWLMGYTNFGNSVWKFEDKASSQQNEANLSLENVGNSDWKFEERVSRQQNEVNLSIENVASSIWKFEDGVISQQNDANSSLEIIDTVNTTECEMAKANQPQESNSSNMVLGERAESPIELLSDNSMEYTKITPNRENPRLCESPKQPLKVSSLSYDDLANQNDYYLIAGIRIGYQLNGLKECQGFIAEKLISDLIFYGNLNCLHKNSVIKPLQNSAWSLPGDNNPDKEKEYILTGKRIGLQLKELEDGQRIIAEKLISDVIFYGRFQRLVVDSLVTTLNSSLSNSHIENIQQHEISHFIPNGEHLDSQDIKAEVFDSE